jgi:hypothetical protein
MGEKDDPLGQRGTLEAMGLFAISRVLPLMRHVLGIH